jgi:KaiC/GvpD/RAD55 family RecA-like ATPase
MLCQRFDATDITDNSSILIVGSKGTGKTTLLYHLNEQGIHCIVSTKTRLGITAIENYEYVFVFHMDYDSDLSSLYHQYYCMTPTALPFDDFNQLYKDVCKDYRCLVIDIAKLRSDSDNLFWYMCSENV